MTDVPSLLPPGSLPLERAIEQASARVGAVSTPQRSLMSPTACPENLLPWLGWALSIDRWDAGWSEADKRAAIASAIADQRIKGSRAAVEKVLASFDVALELVEWWEMNPKGPPHTFDVRLVTGASIDLTDAATIDLIVRAIVRAKPVRSHFEFVQPVDTAGTVDLVAAAQATLAIRLDMSADVGDQA